MNLQPLTLKELSQRFSMEDEFYFEKYEDGFFTFFTNSEPFPQSVSFFPSPYARLTNPATIRDLCAAIDTARHFSLDIHL